MSNSQPHISMTMEKEIKANEQNRRPLMGGGTTARPRSSQDGCLDHSFVEKPLFMRGVDYIIIDRQTSEIILNQHNTEVNEIPHFFFK